MPDIVYLGYHLFLALDGPSLARFIRCASSSIFFTHRATRALFSSWVCFRSCSATFNCRFNTANSSWTSATSLFFWRSSSSRSRSFRESNFSEAARSRRVRASDAVLLRKRASSSSAVLSRVWREPLARRASARSTRKRAMGLVSSAAGTLGVCGLGLDVGALLEELHSCRAAFSASRVVTRSMSWESVGWLAMR